MSRTGGAIAVTGLAAGLLVVSGGCSGDCSSCREAGFATFNLACNPNNLTSVVASGPCSMPDASLEQHTGTPYGYGYVAVGSPSPGVCHIVLTFATGFTYSADVTFTSESVGCKGCPPSVGPTSGPFTVNNPSDTCVALPEAGADATQLVPCTSEADCPSGQTCCSDICGGGTGTTRCQPGPCGQPPCGPIQLCEASTDCFVKGDTCGPLPADPSLPIMVCNQPSEGGADGGSEAGVDDGGAPDGSTDSGTSDAPAGG